MSRRSARTGRARSCTSARAALPEEPPWLPRRLPKNLRILPVADSVENCGLRKIGVRRSGTDPDLWDIYASVRNYGSTPKSGHADADFGGGSAGARRLIVPPGSEREVTFTCRTRAAGLLEATLLPHDGFPEDDHAVLELPPQPSLTVAVYSNEPDLLRPIVTAIPRVHAIFRPVSEYRPDPSVGLVILDRFAPPAAARGECHLDLAALRARRPFRSVPGSRASPSTTGAPDNAAVRRLAHQGPAPRVHLCF